SLRLYSSTVCTPAGRPVASTYVATPGAVTSRFTILPSIDTSHSLGAPSIQSSSISFIVADTDVPSKRATIRQPGHAHVAPAELDTSNRPTSCTCGDPGSTSSPIGI